MHNLDLQDARMPALGLGTFELHGDDCRSAVEHGLALGYRHIDTAEAYENEAEVGRALANASLPRDSVFLTTKVWYTHLRAEDVRRALEGSLSRLRTDYVDLYLIHWPSDDVPLDETLSAMLRLREEGKLRHIGVSNFTPSLFTEACELAPILANQVEYHPYLDQSRLLDLARQHDATLTAYRPLAKGQVARNHTLKRIARTHDKTEAQVTLRWLVQQTNVSAIPRSGSERHRAENADIWDFELSAEEMASIDELARGQRQIDPAQAPDWGS